MRFFSHQYLSPQFTVSAAPAARSHGYQILVGRPPHEGATPLDAVMKVLNEKPIRPRDIDGKLIAVWN